MKCRPEYDKKLIGRNLRRCRQAKKLTVDQVREYLSLGSVQAIYKWEEGTGYPQTDTMFALMELYEIGLPELLQKDCRTIAVSGNTESSIREQYEYQIDYLQIKDREDQRRLKAYFECLQNGAA